MAGICGIILKECSGKDVDYEKVLSLMLSVLGCSESQPNQRKTSLNFYIGNVTMVSDKENTNFIINEQLGVFCTIDGLVYVDNEQKEIINHEYQIEQEITDKQYIPYLYSFYGSDFLNKITGWYNVFLFDSNSETGFLFNDRLGYLPLFYYESSAAYLFSSKIESILASGLMPKTEFDLTSIAEHLFFNYTLSDNTFIEGIKTLEPSTLLHFNSNGSSNKSIYWDFKQFIVEKPHNKREGLNQLNAGLKKAFSKLDNNSSRSLNVSLTGGWDSRVVLSYLLHIKEQLHLFSYGAKDADDITIPQNIAKKEGIKYTPYILSDQYLKEEFSESAFSTINNSNGIRSYKRAHYNYAFKQLSKASDIVISGIYGDEIFKVAGLKPGEVISKNAIDYISSNFDVKLVVEKFKTDIPKYGLALDKKHIDEFEKRMLSLEESVACYKTISEKFYYFRFFITLRKYFGVEVNSYNDYCYNFSPFIDYDFISAYFKSYYCGIYYPFNSNSIALKRQTTRLYSKLIRQKSKALANYQTDRGYSMADALSFKGTLKILTARLFKRVSVNDTYNTLSTDAIFKNAIAENFTMENQSSVPLNWDFSFEEGKSNSISLYYWLLKTAEKYIKQ